MFNRKYLLISLIPLIISSTALAGEGGLARASIGPAQISLTVPERIDFEGIGAIHPHSDDFDLCIKTATAHEELTVIRGTASVEPGKGTHCPHRIRLESSLRSPLNLAASRVVVVALHEG